MVVYELFGLYELFGHFELEAVNLLLVGFWFQKPNVVCEGNNAQAASKGSAGKIEVALELKERLCCVQYRRAATVKAAAAAEVINPQCDINQWYIAMGM